MEEDALPGLKSGTSTDAAQVGAGVFSIPVLPDVPVGPLLVTLLRLV